MDGTSSGVTLRGVVFVAWRFLAAYAAVTCAGYVPLLVIGIWSATTDGGGASELWWSIPAVFAWGGVAVGLWLFAGALSRLCVPLDRDVEVLSGVGAEDLLRVVLVGYGVVVLFLGGASAVLAIFGWGVESIAPGEAYPPAYAPRFPVWEVVGSVVDMSVGLVLILGAGTIARLANRVRRIGLEPMGSEGPRREDGHGGA